MIGGVLLQTGEISDETAQKSNLLMNNIQSEFLDALEQPYAVEALFDRIADTVYFVKDQAGRYIAVNQTLVERCGRQHKSELVGRTALDVFPAPLGALITSQDQAVLQTGKPLLAKLELHLYPGQRQGWCLTWKEPLLGKNGETAGITGISRDLQPHTGEPLEMESVSVVLNHVEEHLDQALRLPELANLAGLSAFQLDKRIKALFGISASQYVTRARIEGACNRLRYSADAISQIAQDCGYSDQASFTRQFRRSVGLTPRAYRESRKQRS
jgi:AraC-like DNA-binding protein